MPWSEETKRAAREKREVRKAQQEGMTLEESIPTNKFSRDFYLDRKDAAEECGMTQYSFKQIVDELGLGYCPDSGFCRYTKKDLIQVRAFKQLMDDLEMGVKDTLKVKRAIAKSAARKKAANEEKEPETDESV